MATKLKDAAAAYEQWRERNYEPEPDAPIEYIEALEARVQELEAELEIIKEGF